MTKSTAISPSGDCPLFLSFIDKITGGDSALFTYLQRLFGYALTGITREHALAFLHGLGANGKSVLVSTVAGIMGDYHVTAPIQTFTASAFEQHPTDLAGLVGARLVTATETEEGARWAEAKIKALTGGDRIKARFMRQDFFDYQPQFTLVISGNHKPGLRNVDEAIRRRFHLVPFRVTIPAEQRDRQLSDKLKAEWPGILSWLIKGCLAWQREGLAPPHAVVEATDAYLSAEDAFTTWRSESCAPDPAAFESTATLWASFSAWAERAGEQAGKRKHFIQRLQDDALFQEHRTEIARGFRGFRLTTSYA